MFTFLRADFIVYIRPDLQIVTLGKWAKSAENVCFLLFFISFLTFYNLIFHFI